jgi:hypothetical protein
MVSMTYLTQYRISLSCEPCLCREFSGWMNDQMQNDDSPSSRFTLCFDWFIYIWYNIRVFNFVTDFGLQFSIALLT